MTVRAKQIGKQITVGSTGVALVTAGCFALHTDWGIPAMLYLLILVVQSISGEFVAVAVVSAVAAACLEYYFIPPVLEWQINDPEDGITLVTYLVTCLVITRLATRARMQTRAAERKSREASLLYDTASRLLAHVPADGVQSLRIFRQVFGLQAAAFFDADARRSLVEGESRHDLEQKTRDAGTSGANHDDAQAGVYVRCLRRGELVAGAVGFEGLLDDTLVPSLSVLAATALERIQTFRNASRSAADAEAEILRSAILDAFAHEFKTPLAIILAAAGSLYEIAEGRPDQLELTEFIENQTVRLNQLTTRLLRTARLDRNEVQPMKERLNLASFLRRVAEQCQSQFGRLVPITGAGDHIEVIADSELLGLAVTQLLDNACKYSTPGTPVTVDVATLRDYVEIRVTNQGSSIPPEEQERIFERFVRGPATERSTPGTGLGLYVARKIARAHGGELQFDRANSTAASTTFRIRLPVYWRPVASLEQTYEQEASQSTDR